MYVLNQLSLVLTFSGIAHSPSPCEQVTSPAEQAFLFYEKKVSVNINPNKKNPKQKKIKKKKRNEKKKKKRKRKRKIKDKKANS